MGPTWSRAATTTFGGAAFRRPAFADSETFAKSKSSETLITPFHRADPRVSVSRAHHGAHSHHATILFKHLFCKTLEGLCSFERPVNQGVRGTMFLIRQPLPS